MTEDTSGRGTDAAAPLGDNGARMSTLLRCLTGVRAPDDGKILFRAEPIELGSPVDARHLGTETVFADLGLIEDLQVWQNLYPNDELTRGFVPLRRWTRRR